jgi:hypothetical protein
MGRYDSGEPWRQHRIQGGFDSPRPLPILILVSRASLRPAAYLCVLCVKKQGYAENAKIGLSALNYLSSAKREGVAGLHFIELDLHFLEFSGKAIGVAQ